MAEDDLYLCKFLCEVNLGSFGENWNHKFVNGIYS